MSTFDEIRARLDLRDVIERYGVTLDRHGKALCPFHGEKTPSFGIIKKDMQHWHCFGCNKSGDIITFVQKLCNLASPLDAAKRIDNDYGLDLFKQSKPVDRSEIQRINKGNMLYDAVIEWERKAYITLCEYLQQLEADKITYAPYKSEAFPHPYYVEACHKYEYIEYLVEALMFADFETKLNFFKSHRKEVDMYANKIRKPSVTRTTHAGRRRLFDELHSG